MFAIENKTRQIIAEMLLSMNDKLVMAMRDCRDAKASVDTVNKQLDVMHAKADREAKIKNLVDELK